MVLSDVQWKSRYQKNINFIRASVIEEPNLSIHNMAHLQKDLVLKGYKVYITQEFSHTKRRVFVNYIGTTF